MPIQTRKSLLYVLLAAVILVVLACTCGPLSGLTGAQATLQAATTQVAEQLPTVEAAATQAAEVAPTLGAVGEGDLPAFDGGDGYQTTQVNLLTIGGSASGTLEDISQAHNWLFEGSAGQIVTIRVVGDEIDTRLALIDPSGNLIAREDDSEGVNPVIVQVLPTAGLYTARVDAWSPGSYTITIQEGGIVGEGGQSGPIRYEGDLPVYDIPGGIEDITQVQLTSVGQTVTGTSGSLFDAHNWLFQGTAGQTVTLTASSTDGSSDVVLYLLDPNGTVIVDATDLSAGGSTETISISLPVNGLYTVRVEFWAEGSYSLTIQ